MDVVFGWSIDLDGGAIMTDANTPEEKAELAFDDWWTAQTRKGDPMRNPNIVFDAYVAAHESQAAKIAELEREMTTDRDYSVDEAMRLSELWSAGKLIGGDAVAATIALGAEVKRLREQLSQPPTDHEGRPMTYWGGLAKQANEPRVSRARSFDEWWKDEGRTESRCLSTKELARLAFDRALYEPSPETKERITSAVLHCSVEGCDSTVLVRAGACQLHPACSPSETTTAFRIGDRVHLAGFHQSDCDIRICKIENESRYFLSVNGVPGEAPYSAKELKLHSETDERYAWGDTRFEAFETTPSICIHCGRDVGGHRFSDMRCPQNTDGSN